MANRNWASGGKLYSMHVMPVLLDATVVIDSTQIGQTKNLKGPGVTSIKRVAIGMYQIRLQDNYNRYYGGFSRLSEGLTGSVAVTAATAATPYIIKSLGTTTQVQWEAMGVPKGVIAAVGLAFIASGAGVGSALLGTPLPTGIDTVEIVGDPNTSLASIPYGNAYVMVRTLFNNAPVDPVDGSSFLISLYLSNSSILIAGE